MVFVAKWSNAPDCGSGIRKDFVGSNPIIHPSIVLNGIIRTIPIKAKISKDIKKVLSFNDKQHEIKLMIIVKKKPNIPQNPILNNIFNGIFILINTKQWVVMTKK